MTLVMSECSDCCLVYMDDLLVYSETQESHQTHVARVFATLTRAGLKAKMSKCVFGAPQIEFLGYIITHGTINMEEGKKNAILGWKPSLETAKQVRQFMGMVSYYRNFIPQLATIAEPLTRLTRKRTRLEWG